MRCKAFNNPALFFPWTFASLATNFSSSRFKRDDASSNVETPVSDESAKVNVLPKDMNSGGKLSPGLFGGGALDSGRS